MLNLNLKKAKQLNQEKLMELSEALSEFSEKPTTFNWYTKTSKSSAIMNIENFEAYYELTHLYIAEDGCPIAYIPIRYIEDFIKEWNRLILKTTDMIYIIETA